MTLAEPPESFPPEDVEFTDLLVGLCDFDVQVSIEGKEGAIFFEDRSILTAPGLTAELTNVETGETISLTIPGRSTMSFWTTAAFAPRRWGGTSCSVRSTGSLALFLTIGKIVLEWSPNDPIAFDLIIEESPGKMVDLCAELAG